MFRILLILVLCVTATSFSNGQKDPGPRSGTAGAGGPYLGLNSNEQTAFSSGRASFRWWIREREQLPGKMARDWALRSTQTVARRVTPNPRQAAAVRVSPARN